MTTPAWLLPAGVVAPGARCRAGAKCAFGETGREGRRYAGPPPRPVRLRSLRGNDVATSSGRPGRDDRAGGRNAGRGKPQRGTNPKPTDPARSGRGGASGGGATG